MVEESSVERAAKRIETYRQEEGGRSRENSLDPWEFDWNVDVILSRHAAAPLPDIKQEQHR